MALVNLVGAGFWMPPLNSIVNPLAALSDTALLDADEEEVQFIGSVAIDGGGSKTFGTSGSKISWLPGAAITFAAGSTLTVGVKKASQLDLANGPAARATIGAAAFDVSTALVGGTDTITTTTYREDTMAAGTPFTVTEGDLISVCFHLDTVSGTPSIKVRATGSGSNGFPVVTLVTSGPTYASLATQPNIILTFDDGSIGWLTQTVAYSVIDVASATIGNTNIFANIIRFPFDCQIDGINAYLSPSSSAADFAFDLYSTPLGTPTLVESLTMDANLIGSAGARHYVRRFVTPRTLTKNTDYAIGVRQTTATAVTVHQRDVFAATHFKPVGMGAECYAATSTAGATFAAINSGKRRYLISARICALDDSSYPAAGDVQSGVAFNGTTGTFVVPTTAQVESGVQYGAAGTEFTGVLAAGGGGLIRRSIV